MVMPKIAKINALIRPLADGKDVVWFDLAKKFLDAEGLPDVKLLPDGTHPGPAGYTLWADELLPYLKEICGPSEISAACQGRLEAASVIRR